MGRIKRVPTVMQLEALECGAACLTMILAFHGKWIPLEQVRADCGVSRDGSNALNIVKAARHYGLKAAGYRYEPEALREKGIFPCIVHWEFNHFVVVDGFKGNKVYITDPARGPIVISMEDFDEGFTGICLQFEPGEDFVKSGRPKSMLGFTKKRLVGLKSAIAFIILTTIVSSILGVISPVFGQVFLDRILTGQNPEWFIPFMWALAAVYLIEVIVQLLSSITMLKIGGKMSVVGNLSFMWKVLNLPMEFFSQRMTGDILQRQTKNVLISNTLVNTIAPLFLNTIMMFFYLLVMIKYSPVLALIGVLSALLNVVVSRLISKKRINITRVMERDAGKLYSSTVSGVQMVETIKASGVEDSFFETWSGHQAALNKQKVNYVKVNNYLGMVPSFVSTMAGLVILGIGVLLTMRGEFTLGMITAFQGFYSAFLTPASSLITAGQTINEMRTQMERIEDVMEYPTDVNCLSSELSDEEYEKLSGEVEIKDLEFGYSKLSEPLIRDLNLSIKKGQRVAIVGASGCGKSTIAKLISGLYTPWSGSITFDGKPINEIDHSVFTGSVSVVDQDIILFEDTIQNNIKMWDSSIEDFEMILAARDAQIHDDIAKRPYGYENQILEGGRDLSGGQRQRLEIARVLAHDPTIIILDEATSALDAKTEYDVVNAIKNRGITCIVVAHRLSTIRDCDEIVVLDNGLVVERGTHDELMAQGGKYKDLITND